MRVWEKIDPFQEERGSWNGWLTSLTRHAALNHARRISRHGGAEALSEDPPSPELTPEEVLLRQERQTALQAALEQLSAGARLLFYRKYYYLPSTAQIALELGLTERAVEGRLYRLKRQLRKCREVMRVPKEDWGFLNEKAFEAALQASVPERLPDKVAAAVTPWKRAMGRVLAGCGAGLCLISRYPMQWQPKTPHEETELAVQLLELGFPDYGLPAPAAGGDRGLSWGHTGGGQRSGVRPGGRLLPEQRLQPAVHNRGRGKADGRACRLDDLPPLSLEHGPALPWDSRHTALAGIPVG